MTTTTAPIHHFAPDGETLARDAAEWLCALASRSLSRFSICLSGGSTPKRLYEVLAERAFASRIPWDRVHWFWGDERFVPHDHPDSNYRMTRTALFDHVAAPQSHLHPIPTAGITTDQSAAAYAATLRACHGFDDIGAGRPLFDVVLLGIGEDGHTASLFPGDPALEETRRWAAVAAGAKPPRITLTYPAINSARHVAFLAAGGAKREMVARALRHDERIPAGRVRPLGTLHWFMDLAAGAGRSANAG